MNFKDYLNKLIGRSISYNDTTGQKIVTWMGHEKAYDFEGFLISDTFKDKNNFTIKNTFYPGTNNIFSKKVFKNNILTDEVWYDLKGKMKAYFTNAKPEGIYLLSNNPEKQLAIGTLPFTQIDRALFEKQVLSLMDIINKRTAIINYNLAEISNLINKRIKKLTELNNDRQQATPKTVGTPYILPVSKKDSAVKPTENITTKTINPTEAAPAPKVVKLKLTSEERKDRWEEQLLKRMEKHDALIAMKEKVLASKRMNPDKKTERLASLDKRLMQNERAQHILNARLKAMQMAQDRDTLKQFKTEERSEYKQWQAEVKKTQSEIKAGTLQGQDLANKKAELKELRTFKKASLTDYRMAAKSTKQATTTLRKLKSTKRQNTIFELNAIVREKTALEESLKTEANIITYARIQELAAKKRALVRAYKESTQKKTPRVADMKRPIQISLPGIQQHIEK